MLEALGPVASGPQRARKSRTRRSSYSAVDVREALGERGLRRMAYTVCQGVEKGLTRVLAEL